MNSFQESQENIETGAIIITKQSIKADPGCDEEWILVDGKRVLALS